MEGASVQHVCPVPLEAPPPDLAPLIGILLLLLVGSAIVWVYADAKQNSTQSPALWALAVLLAPPLSVVLYLLVGQDT